jgi:hypothetical protein
MSTIGCNEFFAQLDQWMEGERPSNAQSHVRECAQCRGLVNDLETIHQTARSWVDVDPPAQVALTGPLHQVLHDDPWMMGMQNSTQPLSAKLDTAEQATMSSLLDSNPVVTASLHKNLAIVDNYIALCEKNVHEDPESEMARDYLYEAYQQKADLLAQMTERGNDGR